MSLSTTLGNVGGALGVMVAGLCIAVLGYSGLGISVLGFALLSLVLVSWPGLRRVAKQDGRDVGPMRSG